MNEKKTVKNTSTFRIEFLNLSSGFSVVVVTASDGDFGGADVNGLDDAFGAGLGADVDVKKLFAVVTDDGVK
jgi:hypothetical protein